MNFFDYQQPSPMAEILFSLPITNIGDEEFLVINMINN